MGLCGALAGLLLAALLSQAHSKITVEETEDKVFLRCKNDIKWLEGTMGKHMSENRTMDLGKSILDPRGQYQCNEVEGKDSKLFTVQIYYRMCQSCVELDVTSLSGILIANIIATLLLALGVYCFAGHETGRLSGAH
ncbi:T-cell surface glycoprotein CD3 delta chain [Sorex araneus]|uniref:T-cell surface glycoprotein CD3 delta chain n=1 Tax=Sorex araneus TaxID=42254 RepID=UPI00243398E6|nr:T-cell surface glycoprotein CD3 delta chain [Sorex araneus]